MSWNAYHNFRPNYQSIQASFLIVIYSNQEYLLDTKLCVINSYKLSKIRDANFMTVSSDFLK